MKRLFLFAFLIATASMFSQNISGVAYYESKTTMDMDNIGGRDMSEDMRRQIAERMKQYLEKTFILTFDGQESMYKEEEKLGTDTGRGWGMMMNSFLAGVQYKDLSKNQILEEREFFGKQFLINDTLARLDWEVTKESKQIGQYLAIKATALKMVDENDWSMARRRNRDRDQQQEETEKKTDSSQQGSGDPWNEIDIPKEVLVTAWFTPQIPVSNGPAEYGGLPGLILEMNVYRTTLLCSKIVLNPKDFEPIKAPSKGEMVSRLEYNAIVKEKMGEMRERFRGRGGRRGGRGF